MSTSESLVRRKAALRAAQRRKRRVAATTVGSTAAEVVADRVMQGFRLPQGGIVSGYWPLADELDPRPCMDQLARLGHPLALPRVRGRGRPLAFHAWRPDDELFAGPFGVMEPSPDAPVVSPRILLVPLLAFDRQGRRLGYGAGYYDMVLRDLRARDPAPIAIGMAFADQEVEEVPAGPRDQTLDAVATERHLHRCPVRPEATLEAGQA